MSLRLGTIALGFTLCAVAGAALGQGAPAGDAGRGAELYIEVGCYECHNYSATGGAAGPQIAPPMAFEPFELQLRTPRFVMIPYTEETLSDQGVADIYAYLASLPATPDPSDIPLLQTMP
jgi:mono/diheme cytochrome c family protein